MSSLKGRYLGGKHDRTAKRTKAGFRYGRHIASGEVTMRELMRDVDRGYEHFWSKRANAHRPGGFDWETEKNRNAVRQRPIDVARAYLAMANPPRGTLQRMCVGANVSYGSVSNQCWLLRKQRENHLEAAA